MNAVEWVKLLGQNCWKSGGRSNVRYQQAVHQAIMAAIRGGMEFPENDDGGVIHPQYSDGWESCYREAIETGNTSAQSYIERRIPRKPFYWVGRKLFVGESFCDGRWMWQVNSFGACGKYLNATNVTTISPEQLKVPIRRFDLTDEDKPEPLPKSVPKRRVWTWLELNDIEKSRRNLRKTQRTAIVK